MNYTDYADENESLLSSVEFSYTVDPSISNGKSNTTYNVSDIFVHRIDSVAKKLRPRINYTMNNFGQRSEDFKILDGKRVNVLYAGCSTTFGEFLPEGYSWQYQVHKKLSSKLDLSSPATVSFPGGSVQKIIDNIYKYVGLFGKPDYIFVLLPDLFRTNWPDPSGIGFITKMRSQQVSSADHGFSEHSLVHSSQSQYRSLEIFCKQAGIKLYASSWDRETNYIFSKMDFLNYGIMDFDKEMDFSMNLTEKDLKGYDKDFLISAGDNLHPGVIQNMFFANHFIERVAP